MEWGPFGSERGQCRCELSVVRFVWWRRCGGLPAALEPVALAVHLQDVDVMGEPVQQRPGQPLRAEDLGPFVEWQVGGDQDGAPLIALAEDLEEQFRADPRQWDKARFVDDQQVQAGQLPLQIQQPSLVPGLHHFVDQGGGRGEAHRHPPLAGGLGPEPRGRR